MNTFASRQESSRYSMLMYILITIGPISGILSASLTTCDYSAFIIQILITVLSFSSGVFSAILKFTRFEQKSTSHRAVGIKYSSLEGNIQRQLSLNRKDRANPGLYLEYIFKAFDDLYSSTPIISDSIYQKWVTYAKEKGLVVPKELALVPVGPSTVPPPPVPVLEKQSSEIEVVIKGNDSVRNLKPSVREDIYGMIPEMNLYSDGRMAYEMSRLKRMPSK